MALFKNLFKKKNPALQTNTASPKKRTSRPAEEINQRKGELGEYKITIQLDQMPDHYRHISDLLIKNPKSRTGYTQIDHVLFTPYGIFVIETKNYQGTIYGGKDRKTWSVNGKFKMLNPFIQNDGHIRSLAALLNLQQDLFISMVSFTKRSTFKIETDLRDIQSQSLIVYDVELTEFINRKVLVQKLLHKKEWFTNEEIVQFYQACLQHHISDPAALKEHVNRLKSELKETPSARCVQCEKEVSEKVKNFCMKQKKFKGKIYCFEHQKSFS